MQNYLGTLCLALGLGLGLPATSVAQSSWPERPIKLVVGAAAGGSVDFVGRALGDAMARALGQPIVIENRPGAAGSIAADQVLKAAPDGYTIMVASPATMAVQPALDAKWAGAYTMVPVAKLTASPLIIVASKQSGITSLRDLIDKAKKSPGKLNYAHSGSGSAPHLGGLLFTQLTGTDIVGVPFKSGAPAIQSVMSGDVDVTFSTPPTVMPLLSSGRLVPLGVTSTERFSLVPELPGMKESGLPNYRMDSWTGLFVPPKTPPEIVRKLFDVTQQALQRPEMKTALATGGMEVSPMRTTAEFAAFNIEEQKFWAKLVKDGGVKAD